MFIELQKQYTDQEKSRTMGFRFLATVVAQALGAKDADFMSEPDPTRETDEFSAAIPFDDPDVLNFLGAPDRGKKADQHRNQESQGTPAGDAGDGNLHRAEGC